MWSSFLQSKTPCSIYSYKPSLVSFYIPPSTNCGDNLRGKVVHMQITITPVLRKGWKTVRLPVGDKFNFPTYVHILCTWCTHNIIVVGVYFQLNLFGTMLFAIISGGEGYNIGPSLSQLANTHIICTLLFVYSFYSPKQTVMNWGLHVYFPRTPHNTAYSGLLTCLLLVSYLLLSVFTVIQVLF